jgi:methyl acetate hydrolase
MGAQIDQILSQSAWEIPNVVAIAAEPKEQIHQGAFGKRDMSKDGGQSTESA